MVTMLIKTWSRYAHVDRRQIPLFPDWERMRWLSPLPSLGAAFALGVLFALGTPWNASDVIERTTKLMEPAVTVEEPRHPSTISRPSPTTSRRPRSAIACPRSSSPR